MLEDAVKALQAGGGVAEEEAEAWVPQINLGLSVRIPEGYVEDLTERLSLYRRLSNIQTPMEREAFIAELIDRFGPLPKETEHLLQVTDIKGQCKTLGIEKLTLGPKAAVLTFREDTPIDPAHLMMLVRARPNQLKMKPPNKLVVDNMGANEGARVKRLQNLLSEIGESIGG